MQFVCISGHSGYDSGMRRCQKRPDPRSPRGFTLIEVMVVATILLVLGLLVTTGIRGALDNARQAACAGNLRNIGLALRQYADDHQGRFPETTHSAALERSWIFALEDYLGDFEETRTCPADPQRDRRIEAKGTSYVLNSYLFVPQLDPFGEPMGPQLNRLAAIPQPERTLMAFVCSDRVGVGPGNDHTHSDQWRSWAAVTRDIAPDRFRSGAPDHSRGKSNYLYVDGRVESIQAAELKRKIERGENPARPPGIDGLP